MFTGLIEDIGNVESVDAGSDGARLRIATRLGAEIATGDSVSVNGVCLTATAVDARRLRDRGDEPDLERDRARRPRGRQPGSTWSWR